MIPFEFATASQIIFGAGRLSQVGPLVATWGRRALVVTGANVQRAQPLLTLLDQQGIPYQTFAVADEPTVAMVQHGVAQGRDFGCELVIGFGGGSAVDAGKAIAALLTNPGDIFDYLEVIGKAQPLKQPSLPYLAIPTTAGTGSEVTRNAVLASPDHGVKVSLRSPHMLPRVALVDPVLTHSLPPQLTAQTGMDALIQVLEPLVSARANPVVDALCREALPRAARALPKVYANGADEAARSEMALVSLLGGIALANAGLGAVHGFAGPLGGMFHAPHGALCAALLPAVMATNVRALQQRAPTHPALARYDEIARLITGDPAATSVDGLAWVQQLCRTLAIPSLAAYGIRSADFAAIIPKAQAASSMKANPLPLTDAELETILSHSC